MDDYLFDVIGSFGPWQKTIYAIFFYGNMVGIGLNYAMTFLAPNQPFRCVLPKTDLNDTGQEWDNRCTVNLTNTSEEVACTEWEYDSSWYSDTVVSEWDLVCEREWLVSFSKSVFMFGFMVSVFISGQVSDRIGRRPTCLINYAITCISLIASLFTNSIELFLVFRFLQAFGRTGFTTTGYVLLMETVGPRERTTVGITVQLGWSLGILILTVIGYFFRHWFWFQVVIAVLMLPLVFSFCLIPESPRWLLMHGKNDALKELIVKVGKKNKKDLKEDADDIVRRLAQERTDIRKATVVNLFQSPKMRGRTFNMMYLWLVNAFMYYALSFNTNDMFGDPYFNFLLLGILEFPSYAVLFLGMRYMGRRTILVALMLVGGAACLSLLAVPEDIPWLMTALSQCGKFCVTASFGLLYLYTGELFPTVVRSAALGSCSMVARIGSIVAPFSRELGKASHSMVPNILYSVLAISSGLFALWLPETKNRKLPDTLEEGENIFEL